MTHIVTRRISFPCGDLVLGAAGDRLCLCDWAEGRHQDAIRRRLEKSLGATFEDSGLANGNPGADPADGNPDAAPTDGAPDISTTGKTVISAQDGQNMAIGSSGRTDSLNASKVELSVIDAAARQLDEYFRGKRKSFDIPLLTVGTDFQKKVWRLLASIPYGSTASYSELSNLLGCPGAVRAVANANGANAISIFIPCHRVIGSDGSLTGYAGGLDAKRFLLDLEAGEKDLLRLQY